jgi:glycosyltransferase involved in cell wall biosynthesis
MDINKKIKILFIRNEFYGAVTSGGVAALYYGLTNALIKEGHKVIFISSGEMNLSKEVILYKLHFSNLFKNLPEILNIPYMIKTYFQILKIIKDERPNLIFQHHHDFNFVGTLLKRKTKLPFFLHADGVEYWVKKNWGKLYFGNLLKWAEEIQWFNSDRIFVPSEVVKNQLIAYNVNSEKIIISPNSVDPDLFSPKIKDLDLKKELGLENSFLCGFAGTFGHWHGVDTIAECIKYVKDKIPNVKFLLVGDGLFRAKVEEILKRDQTQEYCFITGMVPLSKVPNYLSICDILLTPCKSNDDNSAFFNSPIKLYEYMAMGKPIVATEIGQQAIVLKHNITALLHKENDSVSHANAIIELFNNSKLAFELGLNARKEVEKYHNWQNNANRIFTNYQEVICKSN